MPSANSWLPIDGPFRLTQKILKLTQNILKVRFADRLRSLFNTRSVGRIIDCIASLALFTAATDVLPAGRAYPVANDETPTITVDDHGIWRRTGDTGGHGIEWHEMYRVSGAKLDGVTKHYPYLEIDFEFGSFVELYSDWPGFSDVLTALAERLELAPDWFEAVNRMTPDDEPIVFWTRPD